MSSALESFLSKYLIDPSSGCWIWQRRIDRYGYGSFGVRVDGRPTAVGAHRFAYLNLVGPIPDGLQIDHLCRNRRCVNPAHLEPVTPRENCMRGDGPAARNARLQVCRRGHPLSGDNLLTVGNRRRCLECRRVRGRDYKAKNAVAINAARRAKRAGGVGKGGRKRLQTHCVNGHLFDEANTSIRSNGCRDCRACQKERHAQKAEQYNANRRAAVAERRARSAA